VSLIKWKIKLGDVREEGAREIFGNKRKWEWS